MPNFTLLYCYIDKLLKNNLTISERKRAKQYNNLTIVSGFSLIEILIALFVIVALVTVLFSSSGTLFTTRSSKLQTVAAKIASKEIENLRNIAFASLPTAGTNKPCSTTDPDLSKLKGPPTCLLDVVNYDGKGDPPASPPTDIKQLTVKINWKTDNGATQNIKMDTLIYRNGL